VPVRARGPKHALELLDLRRLGIDLIHARVDELVMLGLCQAGLRVRDLHPMMLDEHLRDRSIELLAALPRELAKLGAIGLRQRRMLLDPVPTEEEIVSQTRDLRALTDDDRGADIPQPARASPIHAHPAHLHTHVVVIDRLGQEGLLEGRGIRVGGRP
jgi:hypothetical protein